MKLYILRRSSALVKADIAETTVCHDVPAAAISCVSNLSEEAPLAFAAARAAWPAPIYADAGAEPFSAGIMIKDFNDNKIPFRLVSATIALGQAVKMNFTSPTVGIADITATGLLTPQVNSVPADPVRNQNRWNPCFATGQPGSAEVVLSAGDLNLANGLSSQFQRLLSTNASSGVYPYAQVDQLLPSPSSPLLTRFDCGYSQVYPQANDILVGTNATMTGAGSLGPNQYASFASLVIIEVDERFIGQTQSRVTDYYLAVPALGCFTNFLVPNAASFTGGAPFSAGTLTTLAGCRGAIQLSIIPLAAIQSGTQVNAPIKDLVDVFAYSDAAAKAAQMAIHTEVTIGTKPINALELLGAPLADPARGYNI